jgi:hypothetical protein
MLHRNPGAIAVAALALASLAAPTARAGEKALMHCFAFTAIPTASQADWNAFYQKTDALPSKVPGLMKVWYGKLAHPLSVDGAERQYGVCMEMKDAAALKAYAMHPYHREWLGAYEKVRVEGTTTFNILGQ